MAESESRQSASVRSPTYRKGKSKDQSYLDSNQFVDDRSVIVHGYIRQNQSLLSEHEIVHHRFIPPLVTDLVLIFVIGFEWETLDKGWNISCDKNKIEQHCKSRQIGNLFTKTIMKRYIHHWRFKIKDIEPKGDTILGVMEEMTIQPKMKKMLGEAKGLWYTGKTFGWCMTQANKAYSGGGETYGEKVKVGDMIKMTVDLKNHELRYCLNGKDYPKAFDLIRGIGYKFCMTIQGKGKFELLPYFVQL
eukprot:429652_1